MASRRSVRLSRVVDSVYHGDAQLLGFNVGVAVAHAMLTFKLRLSGGVDSLKTANNLNDRFLPGEKINKKGTHML